MIALAFVSQSGLISKRMYKDLAPFREAMHQFKQEQTTARHAREEQWAKGHGQRAMARRRRMSVQQMQYIAGGGVTELEQTQFVTSDRVDKRALAKTDAPSGAAMKEAIEASGTDARSEVKRGMAALREYLGRSYIGKKLDQELHWNIEWFKAADTRAHGRMYRAITTYMVPEKGKEKRQLKFHAGDKIVVTSAPPKDPEKPNAPVCPVIHYVTTGHYRVVVDRARGSLDLY